MTMSKTSPFLLKKNTNTSIKCEKLKNGSLFIKMFNTNAKKLVINLPQKKVNLPLTEVPHKTLNRVKG